MSYRTITYRQRYWKTRRDGVRQRYWKTVTRKVKIKPPRRFSRVTVGAGISAEKRRMSFTYVEIVHEGDEEEAQRRGEEALKKALPDMVAREMGNPGYKTVKSWADYLRDNVTFNTEVTGTRETSLKVFFDDWSS